MSSHALHTNRILFSKEISTNYQVKISSFGWVYSSMTESYKRRDMRTGTRTMWRWGQKWEHIHKLHSSNNGQKTIENVGKLSRTVPHPGDLLFSTSSYHTREMIKSAAVILSCGWWNRSWYCFPVSSSIRIFPQVLSLKSTCRIRHTPMIKPCNHLRFAE